MYCLASSFRRSFSSRVYYGFERRDLWDLGILVSAALLIKSEKEVASASRSGVSGISAISLRRRL